MPKKIHGSSARKLRRIEAVNRAEPLEPRRLLAASSRIVGYFPEYRWGLFNDIDLGAVTHLNYFSISANTNGTLSTANINLAHLDSAVAAAHAQHRTVSITVGPQSFSTIAQSATARSAFAANLVQFANAHGLDGIDLDWEPTLSADDIPRYGTLIDAVHAQTSPAGLTLSAAVNPINHEIPVAAANKLDWVAVMGYDFWPANHSTYNDAINGLNGWHNYGVPKSKLILGVPFYGRKGTTWPTTQAETYDVIVDTYNPSPGVDLAGGWYYNGVTTIQSKTQYVMNNGYAGMMIWELGQDHFDNDGNYTSMSLLPALKNVVGDTEFATLAGGTLTVTGAAANDTFAIRDRGANIIVSLGGSARVFAESSINGIVFNGHGGDDTLTVNSHIALPLTFAGGAGNDTLNVNAGTFAFNADAQATTDNLTINVAPGAGVVFNASQHLAALNLNGGSAVLSTQGQRVLVTRAFSSSGAAAGLNLNDNSMIVDYVAPTSPLASLTAKVIAGRNGGNWNGAAGITSLAAAAGPNTHAVGIAESSALFGAGGGAFAGETVDDTAVLLGYTRLGDSDLSDATDISDFALLATNFNQPAVWNTGDFDYDSDADIGDFALLAANFNQSAAAGAGRAASMPGATAHSVSAGVFSSVRLSDRQSVGAELLEIEMPI